MTRTSLPPWKAEPVLQGSVEDNSGEEGKVHQTEIQKVKRNELPHGTGCTNCGGQCERRSCCFRDVKCRACGRLGHIAHCCWSSTIKASLSQHKAQEEWKGGHSVEECHSVINHSDLGLIQCVQMQIREKTRVTVYFQEVPYEMEVDLGSALLII